MSRRQIYQCNYFLCFKSYPREEWIDQGTDLLQQQAQNALSDNRDEEQSGNYVVSTLTYCNLNKTDISVFHQNCEVAFAYQAVPGQGEHARAKNIQYELNMFAEIDTH